jgi:glycosidase
MALDTDRSLQTQVIYSIYVRAHSPEGTFRAVIPDLDRIRALGTDIIWFMPIHPIGEEGKKGSLGCPYANRDYRSVNPAYGTMADFRELVDEIHKRGMKVLIDVVYNHTSPDAELFRLHPEFYYRNAEGKPGNKFGDWADVIDLDYRVRALWDYQIESLRFWAGIVDGFRCDVATLVPLDFWKAARAAVAEVNPDCIWLAETVHRSFGALARRLGFGAMRDTEAYEAFDIEYDYDVREVFDKVLRKTAPLSQWIDLLEYQEAVYPANYNKLRCLENHDQPRIASVIPGAGELENYTALLYFLKGATLLYAGQEFADAHLPSLFEREPIVRDTGRDLSPLLRRLAEIKKTCFSPEDAFWGQGDDERRIAVLRRGRWAGVFSLDARPGRVRLEPRLAVPDGDYADLLGGGSVTVREGTLLCTGRPAIFRVS